VQALAQGSLLPEVLVAVGLLLGLLVTLTQLFGLSARQSAVANDITTSSFLATDRLEQLRNTPYDQLLPGTSREEIEVRSQVFYRQTTIRDDAPLRGTKTIAVRVTPRHRSASGPDGSVTLSVYRAAEPPRPLRLDGPAAAAGPIRP
jgi:hypothetical protein